MASLIASRTPDTSRRVRIRSESRAVQRSAWAPVAQVRLVPKPAFRAESVPTVRGCGEAAPATGRAVKAFTWGRAFSIVASATPYLTADGPATGSCRDGDTPILGCAITRDIEL